VTIYLTLREAADALRVEPDTVRRWIRRGSLPAVRTPGPNGRGRLRIAREDVVLALSPATRSTDDEDFDGRADR